MSAAVESSIAHPNSINNDSKEALEQDRSGRTNTVHKNYKGFVAGVFSGIAKLSGRFSYVHID